MVGFPTAIIADIFVGTLINKLLSGLFGARRSMNCHPIRQLAGPAFQSEFGCRFPENHRKTQKNYLTSTMECNPDDFCDIQ
uniref:Uncharacterized protein n=1 Tax=Romanomermis culicivorax TaxID=13658 RepID=A0A915KL28_ROMCU